MIEICNMRDLKIQSPLLRMQWSNQRKRNIEKDKWKEKAI